MNRTGLQLSLSVLVFLAGLQALAADPPRLLDSQFNLPEGFHIYKAADRSLTGGSYDLVLDGEGRLLVGDGNAVRRLEDTDGDQVYDTTKVIATGLGGRGPQGLVVYGDHLYAVDLLEAGNVTTSGIGSSANDADAQTHLLSPALGVSVHS